MTGRRLLTTTALAALIGCLEVDHISHPSEVRPGATFQARIHARATDGGTATPWLCLGVPKDFTIGQATFQLDGGARYVPDVDAARTADRTRAAPWSQWRCWAGIPRAWTVGDSGALSISLTAGQSIGPTSLTWQLGRLEDDDASRPITVEQVTALDVRPTAPTPPTAPQASQLDLTQARYDELLAQLPTLTERPPAPRTDDPVVDGLIAVLGQPATAATALEAVAAAGPHEPARARSWASWMGWSGEEDPNIRVWPARGLVLELEAGVLSRLRLLTSTRSAERLGLDNVLTPVPLDRLGDVGLIAVESSELLADARDVVRCAPGEDGQPSRLRHTVRGVEVGMTGEACTGEVLWLDVLPVPARTASADALLEMLGEPPTHPFSAVLMDTLDVDGRGRSPMHGLQFFARDGVVHDVMVYPTDSPLKPTDWRGTEGVVPTAWTDAPTPFLTSSTELPTLCREVALPAGTGVIAEHPSDSFAVVFAARPPVQGPCSGPIAALRLSEGMDPDVLDIVPEPPIDWKLAAERGEVGSALPAYDEADGGAAPPERGGRGLGLAVVAGIPRSVGIGPTYASGWLLEGRLLLGRSSIGVGHRHEDVAFVGRTHRTTLTGRYDLFERTAQHVGVAATLHGELGVARHDPTRGFATAAGMELSARLRLGRIGWMGVYARPTWNLVRGVPELDDTLAGTDLPVGVILAWQR